MSIRTQIAPKHRFRTIAMIVVCFVLGLWGLYDYMVAIPQQQERADRSVILEKVKSGFERAADGTSFREKRDEAMRTVQVELVQLLSPHIEALGLRELTTAESEPMAARWPAGLFFAMALDPDAIPPALAENENLQDLQSLVASFEGESNEGWIKQLILYHEALRITPPTGDLRELPLQGYDTVTSAVQNLGDDVEPPSQFDRITQLFFIACLPFGLWYMFVLARDGKVHYELTDDGTLNTPTGSFTREQIESIDMSRWMSKSIATVNTSGGEQVKLDDYLHKNMHLIVGALAHAQDPEAWTDDARVVVKDEGDSNGSDDDHPSSAEADEPAQTTV